MHVVSTTHRMFLQSTFRFSFFFGCRRAFTTGAAFHQLARRVGRQEEEEKTKEARMRITSQKVRNRQTQEAEQQRTENRVHTRRPSSRCQSRSDLSSSFRVSLPLHLQRIVPNQRSGCCPYSFCWCSMRPTTARACVLCGLRRRGAALFDV